MFGLRNLIVLLCMLVLFPAAASAFVRTMAQSGRPVFWTTPNVILLGNPGNSSGLAPGEVSNLLGDAFSAWGTPGSRASLTINLNSSAPANSANDGINAVFFASQGGKQMDWGVVAVTEVLYYLSTGQIAETDLIFNDNQFLFTGNEGDTGKYSNGRTMIYLRDVATHEAGHVLGLDHSTVNLSSLIYTAFSGQFNLSNDDKSGVRTAYPTGAVDRGALSGSVIGTRGGIFGAHVEAINLATGKIETGALSNPDGTFRVGDMPAGKYAVLMEPLGAPTGSLSTYFERIDQRFCGGSRFRRRFYSSCGTSGSVSVVGVNEGSTTGLGYLSPSCSNMGNPGGSPTSIATAKEISNLGGANFGTIRTGERHYYRVRNVSGNLSARAMTYSLYSPIDVQVEILNADGSALTGATSIDNVESPMPGGKTNYDSLATATQVSMGDYLIQVTGGQRLSSSNFPAGYDLLDADGHYLLAFSVNGMFGSTSITDMSSCASVRNTTQNASFTPVNGSDDEKPTPGCGTLASHSGGNPFNGGMGTVLFTAFGLHSLFWMTRRRNRLALVRRPR